MSATPLERARHRPSIRTPDQRIRVFVSSTLGELAPERDATRRAIETMQLIPVMFELGARPHPPRQLYRAYLEQSDVFLGLYWEQYGWLAPGESISGLEDEYRLAGDRPRLLYVKNPAPHRQERLDGLLADIRADDRASYRHFRTIDELAELVTRDLALLLSERFLAPIRVTSPVLPVPLTSTIGREHELAQVERALRSGQRLVSLTGPGGVGKTRLAVEASRRCRDAFAGGVAFVSLAATDAADRALELVAESFGLGEPDADHLDLLVAAFCDQQVLVVLDNAEQVVGLGDVIARLLERTPGLQLLVTSRHALRVGAEQERPVPPLDVAGTRDSRAGEDLAPAVQLYLERARAVWSGFAPGLEDQRAIERLVRRLDGLPLAIELAAAAVRVLPPRVLVLRLDSGLDLPSGSARIDLPERQRTLHATLDWSHRLLSDDERAVFARLAVFAGGFTLAAVEQVCGDPDLPDVVEPFIALLDKSLVAADEQHGAEPRFHMLETVHDYAREQLAEREEVAATHGRHLSWARALGDAAQPGLCGPGQRRWVTRLHPERPNFAAAVDTALAAPRSRGGGRARMGRHRAVLRHRSRS